MTYNHELLNEAQEALRRADERIWLLEQQVRERDVLIRDYERFLRNLVGYAVMFGTVALGIIVWNLLAS